MEKIITENGIEYLDTRLNVEFKNYYLNLETQYIIEKTSGFVYSNKGFIGKILPDASEETENTEDEPTG